MTGCTDRDFVVQVLKNATALNYITQEADLPPTLIAHGSADAMVPADQSAELYQALQEAGKDVQLYIVEDAAHADRKFFQKEMMDVYAEFIHRVTE